MTVNTSNESNENTLQFSNISSTQDLYQYPYTSKFNISGRSSYRKSFKRLCLPANDMKPVASQKESARYAIVSVLLIFSCSVVILYLVFRNFPKFTEEEWKHVKLPYSIEDARNLALVLNRYKVDHYIQVMAGFFTAYIFLQTFAIPGSLFLTIMSGFLFPFLLALFLVCTCSAVGACLCFMLSQLLGKKLVERYIPERAEEWALQVQKHRDNLFNYILFLRITPFVPNWFINLTAPVIGVPLMPFAMGTFFGVAPPSFLYIQGGKTLQNFATSTFAVSWSSMLLLVIFGCIPLLPVIFKSKLKTKLE